ncbi:MAG TPA: transposase [Anaerolineales bacterium]|nr:transposase [Anaerolineales bacterium]
MVVSTLEAEQNRLNCRVYTYCLMPDHLHFLVSPVDDGSSVLRFTDQFKGKTTNFSWKLGWKGKLWQPRSYDHVVRDRDALFALSEYILDNPVRKELVERREYWRWSGILNPLP